MNTRIYFLFLLGAGVASCNASSTTPPTSTTMLARDLNIVAPVQLHPEDTLDGLMGGALVNRQGCLRIEGASSSFLVIWPMGFELEDGGVSIRDQRSGSSFRLGDRLMVGGGEVPAARVPHLSLSHPIPTRCRGPFWLASSVRQSAT